MTADEFSKLDVGDVIQHIQGKQKWMVASKWGNQLNLAMALTDAPPEEWNLISKMPEGHGSRS